MEFADEVLVYLQQFQGYLALIGCSILGFCVGRFYTVVNSPEHCKHSSSHFKDLVLAQRVVNHVASKSGADLKDNDSHDVHLEEHELRPVAVQLLGDEHGHKYTNEFTQSFSDKKHSLKEFMDKQVIPKMSLRVREHIGELVPSIIEDYTSNLKQQKGKMKKIVEQPSNGDSGLADHEVVEAFAREGIELSPGVVSELVTHLKCIKGKATWVDIQAALEQGYQNRKEDPHRQALKSAVTKMKKGPTVEENVYKIAVTIVFLALPWQCIGRFFSSFTTMMMVYQMCGHVSFAETLHVPKLGFNGTTMLRLSDMLTHALASRHFLFYTYGIMWVPILLHSTQAIWHLMKLHEDLLMKIHQANVLDAAVYVVGVGYLFFCTENFLMISILTVLGILTYIIERLRNQVW